jgi:DNA-binding beta-propeller fold protein YncE
VGQRYIFLADGGNHKVHTLQRDTLAVVATFGHRGRWAGQFESPHSIAIDSKGNLFVAETLDGRRVQKFMPGGGSTSR